jgi:hypothetical protein
MAAYVKLAHALRCVGLDRWKFETVQGKTKIRRDSFKKNKRGGSARASEAVRIGE